VSKSNKRFESYHLPKKNTQQDIRCLKRKWYRLSHVASPFMGTSYDPRIVAALCTVMLGTLIKWIRLCRESVSTMRNLKLYILLHTWSCFRYGALQCDANQWIIEHGRIEWPQLGEPVRILHSQTQTHAPLMLSIVYANHIDWTLKKNRTETRCQGTYTWYSASAWIIISEALRYSTWSQEISQFYLHTHTFIRNRNEPYLPLSSQL